MNVNCVTNPLAVIDKLIVMVKLTRHTSFQDLKLETKTVNTTTIKKEKLMLEFEAFLNLLQREFAIKKKTKTANGKRFS